MQAATSNLFDALLRRADITIPQNAPKREFAADDPRLWKNKPGFQIVLAGISHHLAQCRENTFRVAYKRAQEAIAAMTPKGEPVPKPSKDLIVEHMRVIESATTLRLLKRSKTLRSRYVAH